MWFCEINESLHRDGVRQEEAVRQCEMIMNFVWSFLNWSFQEVCRRSDNLEELHTEASKENIEDTI